MSKLLEEVVNKIREKDPLHGKKLTRDLKKMDDDYFERAESFLKKFSIFLGVMGKDLDDGIDAYLQWIADIRFEQVKFAETGQYSYHSFEEVNQRVYNNPTIMEAHTIGLLLSRFLLEHNYQTFSFFFQSLPEYKGRVKTYLEVGGGHGLFISEALKILGHEVQYDLIDISASSIQLAKEFIAHDQVQFILKDIFEFAEDHKYDFISMAEVLEHVEQPILLMQRIGDLLHDDGTIYITVPANAAAIDHIYLFRNAEEIREVISATNLEVIEEKIIYAGNLPPDVAEQQKSTMMYAAFLKKR